MDTQSIENPKGSFGRSVMRGMLRRCPCCGHGRLFSRYLKLTNECSSCGEALGHIRADDGAAWLTILIVGHIIAPLILFIEPINPWSGILSMVAWGVVTLGLSLVVLPCAKGMIVNFLWWSGGVGAEKPE